MAYTNGYFVLLLVLGITQVVVLATQNNNEPMVAFYCGKPPMHRGVNGWISDSNSRQCTQDKRSILNYCREMYPNHNITNVVEASYMMDIAGWPTPNSNILQTYHVRPYRCIVEGFQSDALLVPQHCKFDHKHNDSVCRGFSYWQKRANESCKKDNMHCESFGMLLNCGLGVFRGVEYVCCPKKDAVHTPAPPAPISGEDSSSDDDDVDESSDADDSSDDSDDDSWESQEKDVVEDNGKLNLYEVYLKGEDMPTQYSNEHKKFVAARQFMHKQQEAKNTQLMKEWTAARDHVNDVRMHDVRTAEKLSKELTERFQRLYNAYEQEDMAEKQQIVALHQQRVQSELNQRKRVAMDNYMRSLEKGDTVRIGKNLRNYIKAEEKDVLHTVNHYSHVKATDVREAARIHPHVIQHLQLCQQRMEQALEMLERYPDVERNVRPDIENFMKKYDDMASRIRNVVLPEPATSNIQTDSGSDSEDIDVDNQVGVQPQGLDAVSSDEGRKELDNNLSDSFEDSSEEEVEDEHAGFPPAHQQHSGLSVQQTLQAAATSSAQLGTTFGIAIGSVAVFVVLVVAVVMLRRRSSPPTNVTHGYVEVDPAASPEERHVANMQMNGYENPTYRYFEVQSTK